MELRRSLLLPYAAEDMFDLIERAEDYPLFLPWCKSVTIHERTDDIVAARIEFSYMKVRFGFTTRNPKQRPYALQVRLVEGPFKHMHCDWQFTPLAGMGCRVSFHMAYEISERVLDKVAAPAVGMVSKSMVDAFVKRAQATLKEIVPGAAPPPQAPVVIAVPELAAPVEALAPAPVDAEVAAPSPAPAQPEVAAPPPAPAQPVVDQPSPAPAQPVVERPSPAPADAVAATPPPAPAEPAPVFADPSPAAAPAEPAPAAPAPAPAPEPDPVPGPVPAPIAKPSTEPIAMNEADTPLLTALRESRLASDLTPDQLQVLATVVRLETHPARALLQREGSAGNSLYAIVEGSLAVVKSFGTPEETPISMLNKGDFAHELGFLDGNVRYASLVAHTESRVLVLEREGLESLIDTHPRVVYRVMCNIVRTVHRIQSRLAVQATELTNYIVKQHGRY